MWPVLQNLLPDTDKMLLRRLVSREDLSIPHSGGKHFEEHLCGTRRILSVWDQPVFVQIAGLCHSLYSTDRFAHQSLTIVDRGRLSQLIGEQAERLVYLFCAVKRGPFFRAISRTAISMPDHLLTVEGRDELGPPIHHISARDAAHLAIIHLANMAEQSKSRNGTPAVWLERFASLSAIVLKSIPEVMPEILSEAASVSRHAEREGSNTYFAAIRYAAAGNLAIETMERCTTILPCLAEPYLWLSYFWGQRGEKTKQSAFAQIGLKKMRLWGTPWDKRLSYADWEGVARFKKNSSTKLEALTRSLKIYPSANDEISTSGTRGTAGLIDSPYESRFESYLLKYSSAPDRQSAAFFPGLRDEVFWNEGDFELASILRRSNAVIQQEVSNLDLALFHNEAENINRTGRWTIYTLLEAGRWNEEHCSRLPHLSGILRASSEVRVAGGLIYLSRLVPGTEVAAHAGPTNMRLRMHFGLQVPNGDCALRVSGIERKWESGRAMVFNDFHEHEVWNRTAQDRLVLLVDVWHPDLSTKEKTMLEAIHRMANAHGRGLMHYWKLNEAAQSLDSTSQHSREAKLDDLIL